MANENEFEHDVEFDDLHPGEVEDEDIILDAEADEDPEKRETKTGQEDDDPDAALDLDALLPPEPTDTKYDQLEARLTEQSVEKRQTEAVSTVQTAISKIESEASDLRKQLFEAREKGDTAKELELEEALDEKRLDLREHKRHLDWYKSDDFKSRLAEQEVAGKEKGESPAVRREQLRATLKANPVMSGWLNKNRWYLNPKTVEERGATALVQNLESELLRKGMSSTDQKFYVEINKALSRRYPEVVKVTTQTSTPRGGGENGGHRRSTNGKVVITAEDQKNMKRYGLDPSNKEHVREYARDIK